MTDWSKIPNESEMDAGNFGPKQIKLFLEAMAKSIMPSCDLARLGASVEEDGTIRIGDLEIYSSIGGWTVCDRPILFFTHPDPFKIFEKVLQHQLKSSLLDWKLTNYACLA